MLPLHQTLPKSSLEIKKLFVEDEGYYQFT